MNQISKYQITEIEYSLEFKKALHSLIEIFHAFFHEQASFIHLLTRASGTHSGTQQYHIAVLNDIP